MAPLRWVGSLVRRFGQVAFEDVVRAAIRADDFAGVGDIEKNTRMACPEWRVGARAVQRQVVSRDFDGRGGGFFSHGSVLCNKGAEGRKRASATGFKRNSAGLRVPARGR